MSIAEGSWRDVALSDQEYAQICELLHREPTDVELGMFGAMWSEHCGYKHSRPLLKRLPTEAPWVVQGPGENAGAVDLGNGMAAVFKVESHNHPSAVEPYQGAATGVGGIVRDIFTMGARPIAILDGLRFGPIDQPRNAYLFSHVVAGIGGYGNCLGVPTVGGELFFEVSYNGNPLVNALCLGIAPVDGIVRAVASGVGNVIMLIGADTGRDGLHGATFSSVDDPEASHRGVIQVGNPFLEKQLMEACLELLSSGSVVAMQDLGAAGLTSSIVECADRGGVGVDIDVATVPRREDGMTPYDIMLSESQERMVLVSSQDNVPAITTVLERWSLNATVIGRVTDDGVVRVREGEAVVVEVPVGYFTDACPTYELDPSVPDYLDRVQSFDPHSIDDLAESGVAPALESLLGSPNIGSRRTVWEQYDHTILTNTVIGPGEGDAALLRIKGHPQAIAISMDCNSRYVYLNPFEGARHAVAEAARNVACVGAKPLGLTNCLNFGSPEKSPADYQLVRAVEGLADAASHLQVPVVSGNVSLYNESGGTPVFPSPLVGCVGVLESLDHRMTPRWREGDDIWLVGDGLASIGGSEYLAHAHGTTAGQIPPVDTSIENRIIRFLGVLGRSDMLVSTHDVSLGGLAVTLAEMAIDSGIGADLSDVRIRGRLDGFWFGEGGGRILVATDPLNEELFQMYASEWDLPLVRIGRAGGTTVVFPGGAEAPLDALRHASDHALSVGVEADKA